MSRTDCHRPGAIVPRDYEYILSYSLPGTDEPGINVNEARAVCERVGWHREGKLFGNLGTCGVCGTHFRHGDLYEHTPTGHIVTFGHECSDKYSLVANRADWCAELEALKRGRAARLEALRRTERYARFVETVPGLADVLEYTGHNIVCDLKAKCREYGSLSDKQIALAFNIVSDAWTPAKPTEVHVAAPTGRVVVRGRVVSLKVHESAYGETLKMTVKCETPAGSWLVWCTCPSALNTTKGDTVEFTATLEAGREAHFVFGKRPTKARVVETATPAVAAEDDAA